MLNHNQHLNTLYFSTEETPDDSTTTSAPTEQPKEANTHDAGDL